MNWEVIKGNLGTWLGWLKMEAEKADATVIVGISLAALFLTPFVKWFAYAGIAYGGYKLLKPYLKKQ